MTKEFVPYQIALDMKELGFDEPCLMCWYKSNSTKLYIGGDERNGEGVSAPLYQQAFRWFRDKKIHSVVQEYDINNYMFSIDDGINRDIEIIGYDTYEEAEIECLKELIEICKK
jgi:hypothetical protein